MKKSISLIMGLMICLTTLSYAQMEQNPEQVERRFKAQTENLTKSLSLTDDQVKKIEALNAGTLKSMKADIEKANELRDKIKKANDERQTKIDNILTAEQKEKFKAIQGENKAKMDERREKMKEMRKQDKNPNKPVEKK